MGDSDYLADGLPCGSGNLNQDDVIDSNDYECLILDFGK